MTVIFAEKIATKIAKTANWSATILPLKLLLFLSAFLSKKPTVFLLTTGNIPGPFLTHKVETLNPYFC